MTLPWAIWSTIALWGTGPGQLPVALITEEFRQTLNFLFHLFPYAKHPHYPSGLDTLSWKIPSQIQPSLLILGKGSRVGYSWGVGFIENG